MQMQYKTVCGFIDCIDADGILGWAGDIDKPDVPLVVRLVIDDMAVDVLTCGITRADVAQAGFPSPNVGFFAHTPSWCLDGNPHVMEFQTSDGIPLNRADVRQDGADVIGIDQGPWRLTFLLAARPPDVLGSTESRSQKDFLKDLFRRDMTTCPELLVSHATEAATAVTVAVAIEAPARLRDATSARAEMALLLETGMFQSDWYLSTYSDIAAAGVDPLTHYYFYGFKDGRRPNPYFDSSWYQDHNKDLGPDENPLVHYMLVGESEGRRPILYFDPAYYRLAYDVPSSSSCLGHYLTHRFSGKYSPIAEFDAGYYAEHYPDVTAAGVDIFEHYISYGFREGRNPSAAFDTRFYRQRYLRDSDESPLPHYLLHRAEPGIYPALPAHESTVARQIKRFTKPGPQFEERQKLPDTARRRTKLLAYYLPQFHAFPENEEWWGKGFTEWTNVARGSPRFIDHYQPRISRDLGSYSLNDKEVMRSQIEMAREGGLFGFVFYFYWFNGSRLMERPLDMFLADPTLDFPLCLMWANENWSRRWDGSENEVLISQDYREADNARLIDTFAAAFRDPRYIRVGGRPLLMLYRPGIIPDCTRVVAEWRRVFLERAGENPIIIMSQSFNDNDPAKFGLDGAIEFPPHKLVTGLSLHNEELHYLDSDATAQVYSYDEVVRQSLSEPPPAFPLIKTLCPSWDNDARRQGSGLVIHGSTPAKYQAWLERLVEHSVAHPFFGEPFVCVNAWNEWAEGTYLEPDLHFGSAYLNATGHAVAGPATISSDNRLLLVGHDAFPGGAQQLLLNIGRTLRRRFGMEVSFLLLGGGKLEKAYAEIAPTKVLPLGREFAQCVAALRTAGFTAALVNTSAAAAACEVLDTAGIVCTLLVHELPRIMAEKRLLESGRRGLGVARQTVFAAPFVRDSFLDSCGGSDVRTIILPQGSYKDITFSSATREALRAELGIGANEPVAIGMGYADLRKGFDLFLQIWRAVRRLDPTAHLCWVGDIDPTMKGYLASEIERAEATGTFHMLGFRDDVDRLFSAADVFILSSREDPYPTVVLEAMSVGIPTIAFAGTGGIPDTLTAHRAGLVVELGDAEAAAAAMMRLVGNPTRFADRERLAAIVAEHFVFDRYVARLCDLAFPGRVRVSVVVPNYNYAHHLPSRLATIFGQTYPVHEIIVLDDCSTDDSLAVIHKVAADWGRDVRVTANERNSGSVFRQWRKAAEVATGDYVWIAEADDESEPRFLERLVAMVQNAEEVALAFTDSRAIDNEGALLWPNHQGYFAEAGAQDLAHDGVYSGRDFVRRFLSERNLILNVSCAIWNRVALAAAMRRCEDELLTYRMAGDWHLYVDVMTAADCHVAYVAEPLNVHRRHAASVTHSLAATAHVSEIARVHALVQARLGAEAPVEQQAGYVARVAAQLGVKPLAEGPGTTAKPALKARVRQ